MVRHLVCALASLTITSIAAAQSPVSAPSAIDPSSWRGEIVGEPTRILNLGSAHLGQLNPPPSADLLEPLIDRLVAFRPDIITQEGVSGEQCEAIRATPVIYGAATLDYCWDIAPVFAVACPANRSPAAAADHAVPVGE
jgi:hypothetical protein